MSDPECYYDCEERGRDCDHVAADVPPTLPEDARVRTEIEDTPVEAVLLTAEGAVESGFTRTSLEWLERQPTSPQCSNPRCVRRYAHSGPCLVLAGPIDAPPPSRATSDGGYYREAWAHTRSDQAHAYTGPPSITREQIMHLLVDHGVWQEMGTFRASQLATAITELVEASRA